MAFYWLFSDYILAVYPAVGELIPNVAGGIGHLGNHGQGSVLGDGSDHLAVAAGIGLTPEVCAPADHLEACLVIYHIGGIVSDGGLPGHIAGENPVAVAQLIPGVTGTVHHPAGNRQRGVFADGADHLGIAHGKGV